MDKLNHSPEFSNFTEPAESTPEKIAFEKLKSLGPLLNHYTQSKGVYIDMNGSQTELSDEEVIAKFEKSPALFHKTSLPNESKFFKIAKQGLTTENLRNRANIDNVGISEETTETTETALDEDSFLEDMLEMEYMMDQANRGGTKYNKKYISFSWIPWWNERAIQEETLNPDYTFDDKGNIEDIKISIALDEQTSKRIISENLRQLNNPDSELAQLGRLTSFCEALEPIRKSPRHFAAIFVLEGPTSNIQDFKKRELYQKFIERMGQITKIPIFNYDGDLLWPEQKTSKEVNNIVSQDSEIIK